MISRYYEDELHYLHEAGKEFAKAHPEEARFLNIESVGDRDPYVERLFEGFAFLTGRIREQLDDELPEFTEALFNLLWPHFLKPIPGMAIVEFKPRPGLVQQTTLFAAGTEVRSDPVGEEGTTCRFRTTQDVRLQPIQLLDASMSWPADGTTNVSLRLGLERGIEYSKLQLNPLRLYFHAEDPIASMMHLFFTRHVSKVIFSTGDTKLPLIGQQWVKPSGLAANEGLVPYSLYSFSGFRYLQEYLSFRRKFLFVDLLGLDRFTPPQKTTEFQVQIFFSKGYPEEKRFKTENIRLFCTPVVNLFRADAEPIRLDHTSTEYRVFPDARHPKTVEPYSIESVTGTEEGTGEKRTYVPFFTFEHGDGKGERYYVASSRIGPSGRYETYLRPGGFAPADGNPLVETLSLELMCTNGSLPREKIGERMITQPAPEFSNVATFENLTIPTLPLYPPMLDLLRLQKPQENFLWKFVSHLSLNHMSVAGLESLRGVLELYDWTGTDANRRRIAGLRTVAWTSKEIISRGAVVRGAEVTMEVQDGHFADEGDLCLFGLIMSEFFALYATINSFVHLTLITKPSEQKYQWQPQRGARPIC